MNYQNILENIYLDIRPYEKMGRQADYIPALAAVNPDQFGICIHTLRNDIYALGQADTRFSVQSISKVFSLAYCMSIIGDDVWKRMGKEPSGTAFNSLIQLEIEKGRPRNPFINAGAIVMADILLSRLDNPKEQYLRFLRSMSGNDTIGYNETVAISERSQGYLNAAIYFLTCSVEMSCRELSRAFLAFADHHKPFSFGDVRLTASQVKRINAIMQTCGFYDEAGEFSYLVGLPGKSGVGGGIAAVYPSRYSVAVWSPRLNDKGNSVMGMKALELLTTETEESIF